MLETRFPRIPGDVGTADTWPFPVHYAVVEGASATGAVEGDARMLLPGFIEAGRRLVALGCSGIVTSCGFLVLVQDDLRAALGVPVATSALLQVPMVQALLPPDRRVGILTISATSLGPAHLAAAGITGQPPVQGMEGTAFADTILRDRELLDVPRAREALVHAAEALRARTPDLGALVLECTNMSPYAPDIARATGLPVYSAVSLVRWFQSGLHPPAFPDQR